MAISSLGSTTNPVVQSLLDMRTQFDDLSRQLSSGQKSVDYAGLGVGSGLSVNLNSQLSAITGYDNTIDMASTRINLAQNVLGQISNISSTLSSSLANGNASSGNVNIAQYTAQSSLQQLVSLLNTQAGNRYLFSGLATDQSSVESYDHILNGDGARAGLTQLISERTQADYGTNGLGRLNITAPTSTSVQIAEDSTSPFGFKLGSVSSSLSNATVTGPSGAPPGLSVSFTGQPNDGEKFNLSLTLPDGSTQNITLTATTTSPPAANQFLIGASLAATASNLQSALTSTISNQANTSLKAASAVKASNDFFGADSSNPPQRVVGPPFDTATSLTTGTTANTVIWYTGENGAGTARSTATARIDPSLVVSYGLRANETGIRTVVQNVATLAAVTISQSDPNAQALASALDQRLANNLSSSSQSVSDIEAELAGAQTSMQTMKSNHQQTSTTLQNMLQQITGVSNEEVGSEILALQTRMQASMQTTAMLYQTNLVNYLK